MTQTGNEPSGIRKRIVGRGEEKAAGEMPEWMPVEQLAQVEVSSEDPAHPIEHALLPRHEEGWRAAEPGKQIIRLLFDQPQLIGRIYLHFTEKEIERTQEIVLRWAETPTEPRTEIVRQQWNFSPSGAMHEIEDYHPSPRRVSVLELEIVPSISGGDARASLQQFFLA